MEEQCATEGVPEKESDIKQLENKDKIKESLRNLNKNRNKFAHGENIDISFNKIVEYFNYSIKIIEVLDNVIENE